MTDNELEQIQSNVDEINHRNHVSFDSLPTTTEHPARVERVWRCIAEARQEGLTLPRGQVGFRFVSAPGRAYGEATRQDRGGYAMTLNSAELPSPKQLRETVYHELMHINDFASGWTGTLAEAERRARDFSARMMATWPERYPWEI